MKIKLSEVRIKKRHRKELGDLTTLMASMEAIGLLHPIVLNSEHNLISGERRLVAATKLGWETIAVTVAANLDDALKALQAERDENVERKDFMPSEAVAMADALLEFEKPRQSRDNGSMVELLRGAKKRTLVEKNHKCPRKHRLPIPRRRRPPVCPGQAIRKQRP